MVTVQYNPLLPEARTDPYRLGDGTEVCLANVDGVFYAIGGECSHQGGPPAERELHGIIATCPWHGAMFDVTSGEVQGPPADDSGPAYQVRLHGDDLQVAVG